MTLMTHTPSTHLAILRQFIERERGMRTRVLKGESQRKGIDDANQALVSLDALQAIIHSQPKDTL